MALSPEARRARALFLRGLSAGPGRNPQIPIGAQPPRMASAKPIVPPAPVAPVSAVSTPPPAPPPVTPSPAPVQAAPPPSGGMNRIAAAMGPPEPPMGPPSPPPSPSSPFDDPDLVNEIVGMSDLDRQLAVAEGMRDQEAPGGRYLSGGRMYVASSPIEHGVNAFQRFRGTRRANEIGDKQVAGRRRIADVLKNY